ncbi:serine protease [Marinigracilibium pacificum]|uniref:Serine protease n=1 Tax=Marinigracilibium pacificum TaxID=2729599 RepID=A0A848J435_9BACT|nr:serine protease [Marinigracilibium pacificum]NMM50476.1 serine protease [Marinigracilibium pacificum]
MAKFNGESLKMMTEVQSEVESDLLNMENVVGVALGNKIKNGIEKESDQVMTVFVDQKLPEDSLTSSQVIQKEYNGVKTDVVEIGEVFAGFIDPNTGVEVSVDVDNHVGQQEDILEDVIQAGAASNLKNRIRPAKGGYSCGHYKVTAGTIATCCYDLTPFPGIPSKYYLLSNNHVIANSNNCRIGDPILQPGRVDGGTYPRDVIARLSRYIPIKFITSTSQPYNYVDAAIGEGNFQDLDREIYWQGCVKKLYDAPKIGEIVQKTGRTTGFTTGKITNINATVNVNYGSGRVAKFCKQIVTSRMSAPGDSGSLIMDREENAVGLLFAGSSTRTIVNNILFVQSLLKIRLSEK